MLHVSSSVNKVSKCKISVARTSFILISNQLFTLMWPQSRLFGIAFIGLKHLSLSIVGLILSNFHGFDERLMMKSENS